MLSISHLGPLQRDALREAMQSPTHTLVRTRAGYIAHHKRQATSGDVHAKAFTPRLINMLDRDGLVHLDDPDCPSLVTLNAHGIALAEQLQASAKEGAR
jgi:hypothetical protein